MQTETILEIAWFFEINHGAVLWPDEIAPILGLDVRDTIDACHLLLDMGELATI